MFCLSAGLPLRMLDWSPEPAPPNSATFSGVRKYVSTDDSSALVTELSNHISRKNAIMAVTKSA